MTARLKLARAGDLPGHETDSPCGGGGTGGAGGASLAGGGAAGLVDGSGTSLAAGSGGASGTAQGGQGAVDVDNSGIGGPNVGYPQGQGSPGAGFGGGFGAPGLLSGGGGGGAGYQSGGGGAGGASGGGGGGGGGLSWCSPAVTTNCAAALDSATPAGEVEITIPSTATATGVTASPDDPAPGGTVTFTVTVAPAPTDDDATAYIEDEDGHPVAGSCASIELTGGSGTCTALAPGTAGDHDYTAQFSGTDLFDASSGGTTVTVAPLVTTTTAGVLLSELPRDFYVNFTAQVDPSPGRTGHETRGETAAAAGRAAAAACAGARACSGGRAAAAVRRDRRADARVRRRAGRRGKRSAGRDRGQRPRAAAPVPEQQSVRRERHADAVGVGARRKRPCQRGQGERARPLQRRQGRIRPGPQAQSAPAEIVVRAAQRAGKRTVHATLTIVTRLGSGRAVTKRQQVTLHLPRAKRTASKPHASKPAQHPSFTG